jgi:hypothetical protein
VWLGSGFTLWARGPMCLFSKIGLGLLLIKYKSYASPKPRLVSGRDPALLPTEDLAPARLFNGLLDMRRQSLMKGGHKTVIVETFRIKRFGTNKKGVPGH